MRDINDIISTIVRKERPDAEIRLFGSRARNDARQDSDWDVLVIVGDDHISTSLFSSIGNPIYNYADENGIEINPIFYTRRQWENRHPSLFKKNIEKESVAI